jgi:hypothetical protein
MKTTLAGLKQILYSHGLVPSRVVVSAGNWDLFGGRLVAIMDGLALAKAFNLQFEFAWPVHAFPEMDSRKSFFSAGFLARHLVSEGDFETGIRVTPNGLRRTTRWNRIPPVRRIVGKYGRRTRFVVDTRFGVTALPSEPRVQALKRFADAFQVDDLSDQVVLYSTRVQQAAARNPYAVLHLRMGDVVAGPWATYLPLTKYLPMPIARAILEQAKGQGLRTVVVSDSPHLRDELDPSFEFTISAEPFLGELRSPQSVVDRDLEDLLIMRFARQVTAPPQSAFSRLGAQWGAHDPMTADEVLGEEAQFAALSGSTLTLSGAATPFHGESWSRDLLFAAEHHWHRMKPEIVLAHLTRAVELDPTFVHARCLLADCLTAMGRLDEATAEVQSALEVSSSYSIHPDALLLSVASQLGVLLEARRRLVQVDCVDMPRQLLARLRRMTTLQVPATHIRLSLAYCVAVERLLGPEYGAESAAWPSGRIDEWPQDLRAEQGTTLSQALLAAQVRRDGGRVVKALSGSIQAWSPARRSWRGRAISVGQTELGAWWGRLSMLQSESSALLVNEREDAERNAIVGMDLGELGAWGLVPLRSFPDASWRRSVSLVSLRGPRTQKSAVRVVRSDRGQVGSWIAAKRPAAAAEA